LKRFVVIVAGGSGSRMKSDIPKQFLLLAGKPVLMHTLEAFNHGSLTCEIVLVLPEAQIPFWNELILKYQFQIPHLVVLGGETRFHSVRNGINAIQENEAIVAIHDGVRPLVSTHCLENSFRIASEKGNSVLSVMPKDSLRFVDENENKAVDRSKFRIIQTPQTFKLSIIKKAINLPYKETFTDDASVVEDKGEYINLIEGEYENIKITTPEDLILAEAMLKNKY